MTISQRWSILGVWGKFPHDFREVFMSKLLSFILWLPRVVSLINELSRAWEDFKKTESYQRLVREAEQAKRDNPLEQYFP